MRPFIAHNPTTILFGKGKLESLSGNVTAIGKKVLVVIGKTSATRSGLRDTVRQLLQEAGCQVWVLTGVTPNPEIDSVRAGVKICRTKDIELVLAVGGGSVIDCTKAIAAGATSDGDPWEFFNKKRIPNNPLPIGVILTMSATGTEMNGNSVITNPDTNEKRPLFHPGLYPRFSILDPELTCSTPKDQTAYGAIDILSHVYEQYFHHDADCPIQDGFAETIMRTVIENAPMAIKTPDDYNVRANLMWASTVALNGWIGAGVKGDWACHMIEHELSARYGIAHGAGLAIVFPAWMKKVHKDNIPRFRRFAVVVWGIDPADKSDEAIAVEGIDAMVSFYKDQLDVGVTLSDYGIDDKYFEKMAASATRFGKLGSFKELSEKEIVEIYQDAL